MAYIPILKGKAGEFMALEHASQEVWSSIRPVMEVVPDINVRDVLETFCEHAMEAIPNGAVLTVDCGALPATCVLEGDAGGPVARVSESLDLRGRAMCPVFRSTDSRAVLDEVAAASTRHGHGACLRVSVADDASGPLLDRPQVQSLLRQLKREPEEIDLLVDAGPVRSSAERDGLVQTALDTLERLSCWRWRHRTIAAGAFPVNLTGFPRGCATPVARQDAQLWQRVADQWCGEPPDFGDFGVTHPRIPVKSRGTPDPNMRYTTQDCWQVFVYPRIRSGNDDFFKLSQDLVASVHWPQTGARTSWGDASLQECASRQRPKAGAGKEWRAWATSHHLAVVTNSLTALGRP
ncbi:beta family protein [Streptomyces sp. NPDC055239]